jgi:hypothetical protein
MSKADAIAIFAEGTFGDQVRYLLDLLLKTVALRTKVPTDRRARRVHRFEPTGAGTRTICRINPTKSYRRGGPETLIRRCRAAERGIFCRIWGRQGAGRGYWARCDPSFSSVSRRSLLIRLATEIEGFFNLLYAHLLTLWPADSPETKNRVFDLLPIITSSTAESATKYRMYVFHPTRVL